MRPYHLTFATLGRHPFFPDEAARRAALHALGRLLPGRVVLFSLVDDHVHVVLLADADTVAGLARALLTALRALAPVDLQPPHVRNVEDRRHLETLVGYVLEQPVHHRLDQHPALVSGSCYADLIGARVVPGLAPNLAEALPRYAVADAARHVGLPPAELAPLSLEEVRALGARRLVDAAAFAAGAAPALEARDAASVAARRVAARLGADAGFHDREIAFALRVDVDSVRRLQARPAEPALSDATRLRLALEAAVAAACQRVTIRSMAEAIARRKTGLNV